MIDAYIKLMRLLALSALDAPEPLAERHGKKRAKIRTIPLPALIRNQ